MDNERLNRFVGLMKQIFELDKSDLDFGIYRIMNIRKKEIEHFLSDVLPQKVEEMLSSFAPDTGIIRKRLHDIEVQCDDVGLPVAKSKMANEYAQLSAQLASGLDRDALETDVYSALYSFFNRYYDEGDFVSKRRYKEGVYALPYEGEEVKLYWANQDQYYIKTSENFTDYSFTVEGKDKPLTVHFLLTEATTEQDNNKETKDAKRTFMLYQENEDRPDLKTFEYKKESNELIIRFIFDIPENKKIKYLDQNARNIRVKIAEDYPELSESLLKDVSTDKKKPKMLIDKYLEAYVAKNTFDYFIHKDLKGFLDRELDFYIKNEIIHLDDLDTAQEKRVETYLAKARAVKRIGHIIIDFLAQVEDFQKKLWLKKKFVVETNWCMTLDQIDPSFWPEIASNPDQLQEWKEMYAVDEISAAKDTEGWSDVPSMTFLQQNQNLIVDTRFFSNSFKDRLVASIDDLTKKTSGLLINSDNFQAEKILEECFKSKVKCIYLDPPYNTNDSSFIYKNNYKDSSWISMMYDRVKEIYNKLREDGVLLITIDDEELYNLKKLLDEVIGEDHYIGTIVIQSNPRGRSINSFYATCHEYCLCYAKNSDLVDITDRPLTEEQKKEYSASDSESEYRLLSFRRSGGWSTPEDRPNSEFSLYFNNAGKLFAVGGPRAYDVPAEYVPQYILTLEDGNIVKYNENNFISKFKNITKVMPIDTNGLRRVWRWAKREKILSAGNKGDFILKKEKGSFSVLLKDRIKLGRKPKTIWAESKYDSSSHGTNLLKQIFGERNVFGFPKSVYSTEDSLRAVIGNINDTIVLDLFAGSGTTGHAVLNLNREDGGTRKYILVEMGNYFDTVTLPRIKKVIYSPEWKNGKPLVRNKGISQIVKYFSLESYEDALSNVRLSNETASLFQWLGDDYLIHYMLDLESRGSLLDLEQFKNPFSYRMKINERNETRLRTVDLVETFNYLIGLAVSRQSAVQYFRAEKDPAGGYEGAVRLIQDLNGDFAFKQVEGSLPDGRRALVIWRTVTEDVVLSNAALDAYFEKYRINPRDREFDVIYVNGDNTLENLRMNEEMWKVNLTETEFKKRMFEEE